MQIRIKVLINAEGQWAGYGWKGASDRDADDTLTECVPYEGAMQEYWLTADIPVPEAIETPAQCEPV